MRILLNLERLGLLRLVRVLTAGEHVQLLEHAPAERVLRQHALDRELDGALRVLGEQFLERDRLDAADVPGVVVVDLVGELAPGDPDLLRVHHHDVIAHVDVRAVVGLVLALEAVGDLRGEPTQGLVAGVDDEPVTADGAGLGKYGLHRSLVTVAAPCLRWDLRGRPGPKKGGEVYSSRSGNAKVRAGRPATPPGAGGAGHRRPAMAPIIVSCIWSPVAHSTLPLPRSTAPCGRCSPRRGAAARSRGRRRRPPPPCPKPSAARALRSCASTMPASSPRRPCITARPPSPARPPRARCSPRRRVPSRTTWRGARPACRSSARGRACSIRSGTPAPSRSARPRPCGAIAPVSASWPRPNARSSGISTATSADFPQPTCAAVPYLKPCAPKRSRTAPRPPRPAASACRSRCAR